MRPAQAHVRRRGSRTDTKIIAGAARELLSAAALALLWMVATALFLAL